MNELPKHLDTAPVPLLVIDQEAVIQHLNGAARHFGFVAGRRLSGYIDGLSGAFHDYVRARPASHCYLFLFEQSEKRCRVAVHEEAEHSFVWLLDLSEQLALGERIRQLRNPGSKQARRLNQLTITAMGYAELLDLVMQDARTLTTDKLATVKQYQAEITKNLRAIQQVIGGEAPVRPSGTLLVADRRQTLTELMTELLKSAGYKVVGFSDAESVLKFCKLNDHAISKAVIDEQMSLDGDVRLIERLRVIAPDLDIITLSERPGAAPAGHVPKPLDFQVLLRALES